jgi:hypothetical protein
MEFIVDDNLTEVSEEQPKKHLSLIFFVPSGISMDDNAMQPKKAHTPNLCNESGNLNDFNVTQPLKAKSPISVIPSGITREVSFQQLSKALALIDVTLYLTPSLLMLAGSTRSPT